MDSIDFIWKSHIQYLENLRQVVSLRGYAQRDPLVEYKKEAFHLFESLLNRLKLDLTTILMNLTLVQSQTKNSQETKIKSDNPKCLLALNNDRKISRNEKCEATGKKFKHCCGAL